MSTILDGKNHYNELLKLQKFYDKYKEFPTENISKNWDKDPRVIQSGLLPYYYYQALAQSIQSGLGIGFIRDHTRNGTLTTIVPKPSNIQEAKQVVMSTPNSSKEVYYVTIGTSTITVDYPEGFKYTNFKGHYSTPSAFVEELQKKLDQLQQVS